MKKKRSKKAVAKYGEDITLTQDGDVLDTWFSSGLWPFSTMGWPQETDDLATYYPNSTMVTGFDIIFFWVARMTMMSKHFTGKMPFKDVYIHGLVRDENGRKMSKSYNNGIDPLLLCDKYGTDALRYTLIREVAGAGQDISLQYNRQTDESESVEASRNFANKLWNAARFVLMNLDGKTPEQLGYPNLTQLELSDRWILSRFYQVVKQTDNYLASYGLGEAAKVIYEFIWSDFCDSYIELVKTRLRQPADSPSQLVAQQTLGYVLEGILKLLHPFMPHITEEIWHTLNQVEVDSKESLALQSFPKVDELLTLNPPAKIANIDNSSELVSDDGNIDRTVAQLSNSVGNFLSKNGKLLTSGLIVFLSLIILQLLLSIVGIIHNLPLFAPTLRLIGFVYFLWFASQNLLYAQARQKTWGKVAQLKEKFVGKDKSEEKETMMIDSSGEIEAIDTLVDESLEISFNLSFETIRAIRNLRAEAEIKPAVKVKAILVSENSEERAIIARTQTYIQQLAKVEEITITDNLTESPSQAIASVVGTIEILIPLEGIIDVDKLKGKLAKKLTKIESEIKSLEGRLNNPNFANKAPKEVIENTRSSLSESKIQADILQTRLQLLG